MMRAMALGIGLLLLAGLLAQTLCADDLVTAEATVGVAGQIKGLVLPGTELEVAPLDDRRLPIMLRMVDVWQHGDAFRYDLEFIGMEPGEFDLRDYLQRKDASASNELPSIPIRINSLLAAGHVIPHPLETKLPRISRYRLWVTLLAIGWVMGLIGLIAWKRKTALAEVEAARPKTFAELLAPRLAAASAGELSISQLAELERFVVEFWRRRLGLSNVPVNQAILQLRRHDEAGPLLQQLERWIHSPQRNGTAEKSSGTAAAELARLLEPYQQFPAELEEVV